MKTMTKENIEKRDNLEVSLNCLRKKLIEPENQTKEVWQAFYHISGLWIECHLTCNN
jgi:hypothetical protein